VNFTNTLIIMTSNIGGAIIHDTLERHPGLTRSDPAFEELERKVLDTLRTHFRPEFLNRVDETIIFHRLDRTHIEEIVRIQLKRIDGYLQDRNITMELTDEARNFLAAQGYDPAFGARPLKRAIQRYVLDALSKDLLRGDVTDGSHVVGDVAEGENRLVFRQRSP